MGIEGEAYGAIEHCVSNIAGDKRTTALADFGMGVNLGIGLEFTKAWARRIDAKKILGFSVLTRQFAGKWTASMSLVERQTMPDYLSVALGYETDVNKGGLLSFPTPVNGCQLQRTTMEIPVNWLQSSGPASWTDLVQMEHANRVLTISPVVITEAFRQIGEWAMTEGYDVALKTTVTDSEVKELGFELDLGFLGAGLSVGAKLLSADRRTYTAHVCHTTEKYPYLIVTEKYVQESPYTIWENYLLSSRSISQQMVDLAKRSWDAFAKILGYVKDIVKKHINKAGELVFGQERWKGIKNGYHITVEGGKDLAKGFVVGVTQLGDKAKDFFGGLKWPPLGVETVLDQGSRSSRETIPVVMVTNGLIIEINDESGNPYGRFDDYVDLDLSYTDDQLTEAGITDKAEKYLHIFRWNPKTNQWEPIPSTCNTAENYLEGKILNAGIYVVSLSNTAPQIEVLSPQGGTTVTSGYCSITWTTTDDQPIEDSVVDLRFAPADATDSWLPIATGFSNKGEYKWDVTGIQNGEYIIKIIVTDPLGASTEIISGPFIIATVPATTGIIVAPNPVGDERTAFFYNLKDGTAEAKLMIFNVAGQPVFETSLDVNSTRFPSAGRWNPVDRDGIPLANGPYVYVLIADGKVVGQGKMVIQR